eukprot:Pgem_evm1s8003
MSTSNDLTPVLPKDAAVKSMDKTAKKSTLTRHTGSSRPTTKSQEEDLINRLYKSSIKNKKIKQNEATPITTKSSVSSSTIKRVPFNSIKKNDLNATAKKTNKSSVHTKSTTTDPPEKNTTSSIAFRTPIIKPVVKRSTTSNTTITKRRLHTNGQDIHQQPFSSLKSKNQLSSRIDSDINQSTKSTKTITTSTTKTLNPSGLSSALSVSALAAENELEDEILQARSIQTQFCRAKASSCYAEQKKKAT